MDRIAVQDNLQDLIKALGYVSGNRPPANSDLEELAAWLSTIAQRSRPWTRSYLRAVWTGSLEGSQILGRAIVAAGAALDGVPVGIAGAQSVEVFAHNVKAGDLVLGSRRLCRRPDCPVWFVPDHPGKAFHDPECRRIYWNTRRQRKHE